MSFKILAYSVFFQMSNLLYFEINEKKDFPLDIFNNNDNETIIINIQNTYHCPSHSFSCRRVEEYVFWKKAELNCFAEGILIAFSEFLADGSRVKSEGFLKSLTYLNGSHLIFDKQTYSNVCKIIKR